MRRTSPLLALAAALAAVVSSPLSAQSPAGAAPRAPAEMQPFPALERAIGGQWYARWHPATGTPRTIFGTGLPVPGAGHGIDLAGARAAANGLLAAQADLLGLGTSEFHEVTGARMGRTWSFTFAQHFRGLPCIGGRADVRVNQCGTIAMFGSTAWPVPADFDITPTIAPETAAAAAWLRHGPDGATAGRRPGQPRLVIWGDADAPAKAPFALAWEVPIDALDAHGDGEVGRCWVDAKTGALLHFTSDKHQCGAGDTAHHHGGGDRSVQPALPVPTTVTVMAWTRTGLSGVGALANVPVPGLDVQVAGLGTYTTDANGQFSVDLAAPAVVSVTTLDGVHQSAIVDPTNNGPTASTTAAPGTPTVLQLSSSGASPEQAAHASTYHWVFRGNEWARSILGNSAEMAVADQVVPYVNINGACNAFYTNNTINFYPTVGNCNNTAFSTVVLHEWAHGLDDRYGGISNNNFDGLSEGWADIVAMYLVDDPIVGLDFWNGGYIRDGNNGTMYGTQSEVHAAGQVWMGFAWRFRENLRAHLGTTQAIALSNDLVVGSIVADANDQQQAVVEVFVADDNDGNLANGVPHYADLSAAAIAHGMPYPQIQVAWVQHTALADTDVPWTPRIVTAQTGLVAGGSIQQVRLVWTANGGPQQTRVMVPTGNPGEYRGLLPGIESGQIVYHVEATHSSNNVVRTPGTGENRYLVAPVPVGAFVPFYSEDFEGAAAGWTHGALTGSDEWAIGAPAGWSGSSYGIPWSDPASAVSGTQVAGVDLGGAYGNGHYEANGYQYLRSPSFDCTNLRGVHLRFQRWLTCEEGQYDHAQVLVNGNVVWENPEVGAFVDTAWQQVEYAIPMADGNPNVVVEFLLSSDAGLELGGWNLDDVQLGTRAAAPLPAVLRWTPDQVAPATPTSLQVTTPAQQIFAVGLSDNAGPTQLPYVPLLSIGSNMITFSAFTDATGHFQANIPSFGSMSAPGLLWYCQVATIDTQGAFQVSNQYLIFFTP